MQQRGPLSHDEDWLNRVAVLVWRHLSNAASFVFYGIHCLSNTANCSPLLKNTYDIISLSLYIYIYIYVFLSMQYIYIYIDMCVYTSLSLYIYIYILYIGRKQTDSENRDSNRENDEWQIMTKNSSWQDTFDSGVITTPSHQAPDTNDAITTISLSLYLSLSLYIYIYIYVHIL